MKETDRDMTAIGLLNACIAWYLDSPERYRHGVRGRGAEDVLLHMVVVTLGLEGDAAEEWLAEELQDRFAAQG